MRVFLSWSGNRSEHVAELLRDWLPLVIQDADPFMSKHDIDLGSRWAKELDEQMEATDFGILCLTEEAKTAPWVLHEAGALAKSINESQVIPLLIGIDESDVDWPLARFQATQLSRDGMRKVLGQIRSALKEQKLSEKQLDRAFEKWWNDFEEGLKALPDPEKSQKKTEKGMDERLNEIHELVRGIARGSQEKLLENVLDRLDKLERQIVPTSGGTWPPPSGSPFSASPGTQDKGLPFRMPSPFGEEDTEDLIFWLQEHPDIRNVTPIEDPDGDIWLKIQHSPSISKPEVKKIVEGVADDFKETAFKEAEDGK